MNSDVSVLKETAITDFSIVLALIASTHIWKGTDLL